MQQYFFHDLIFHLLVFQIIMLGIVLSNTYLLRRARRHSPPPECPKVSVLVPARNEERSIAQCVHSLLDQDYDDFEIFVLDDQSTDKTRTILTEIAQTAPKLHILDGQPLPEGWLGKNWACAQLAEQASGDVLFFTDADTVHQPHTLRTAITTMEGEGADLLTGFPLQEVHTWGEKFIVPIFAWAFYCFTPLILAYRLKLPTLSNAVGQMLLFRRQAYQAIGGHKDVRSNIAEDLSLAQHIKVSGYRWRVIDATDLIACRMYRNGQEAHAGLSKNLFAAFDFRLLPYLFVWLWLGVMFYWPPLVLMMTAVGLVPGTQIAPVLACIGLSMALWLIVYWNLRLPAYLAVLYPITLGVIETLAARSLWLTLTGRLTWKGRPLIRPRWKWL